MIELSHIHPMLVHFPIALVVFGFVADFAYLLYKKEACLSKTGFYLLVAGTLSAMVALLSGVLFTSEMSGDAGEIQETHELFAWLTVALLTATSVFRIFLMAKNREDSNLKWIAFVLYGIATFSVSLTGFFGGTLVYNYMMPL
ncbi:MAG TPA: hypothetical protein DCQ26_04130 [Marinilabiliales bacterium]|nr:MAG: hypothetical protein A2W95_03310 [Bacteroidetes bacterium GWA2_40_14]OFX58091.1 MAG: hypothetical protein A2W84_08985 [Bacteroidetes bacterium GWC2_40_13]OFX72729.1 MAG: hypothetical protein A2W96_18495 [Bacteroidetes bacterium GWD2_40_43]OFX91359.1 MAG: hypothetical protein A2W97_03915 [Bacteroidetes bacterium GWE2_40_63]OFY19429.1 MAG: hypothetical protein A2W88_01795 [Bacteroidetes bacterium GWF2_40_13]OFZ25579.1 MAG: hypothetical protein A2437_12200 [Bacteroidetes bacterium RIFOXYC